jgi:hypothetical protein
MRIPSHSDVACLSQSWLPIAFFDTVPIAMALLVMTISTLLICRKVNGVDRRSQRWSMHSRQNRNNKTSKLMFLQSLRCCMSFLLTLHFLMISYYLQFQHDQSSWFAVTAAILSPSQGFLNALVYYKRKSGLLMWCCCGNTDAEADTSSSRRRRSSINQSSAENVERNIDVSEPRSQSIGRRLSRRFSLNTSDAFDEYAGVRECWERIRGEVATPFNIASFRFFNAGAASQAAANNAPAEVTNCTDSVPFRTRDDEDQISIPAAVEEDAP